MRGTSIMREKLEEIAVSVVGGVIVILLTILFWLCWEVDE